MPYKKVKPRKFVMEFPESKYKKEMDNVADVSKRFIEKNKKEE